MIQDISPAALLPNYTPRVGLGINDRSEGQGAFKTSTPQPYHNHHHTFTPLKYNSI
jgi:hypothetical protein